MNKNLRSGWVVIAVALSASCVLPEAQVDTDLDRADGSAASDGAAGSDASAGAGGADASAGSAAVAGAAGVDSGGGGSEAGPCPGTGGPVMVKLPQGYCIDSTEVTRAQYEAWLAASPGMDGQPAGCAWNDSFSPGATCMAEDEVYKGTGWGDHPQVCVDWCDAFAYCKAVGKRLCGSIAGGANAFGDYADASKDQWYNACSSGGVNNYPYGGVPGVDSSEGYDSSKCCDDVEAYGTVAVGSASGCQSSVSGYSGVYDLSGNVWEWTDACDGVTGEWDHCRTRGGSYMSTVDLQCGVGDPTERVYVHVDIGFRCCAL